MNGGLTLPVDVALPAGTALNGWEEMAPRLAGADDLDAGRPRRPAQHGPLKPGGTLLMATTRGVIFGEKPPAPAGDVGARSAARLSRASKSSSFFRPSLSEDKETRLGADLRVLQAL